MAIERAVAIGSIAGVIQVRNMFTCEVVPSGGDTQQILWEAYLTSIFDPIMLLTSDLLSYTQYELQEYNAGHWIPYDLITWSKTGSQSTEAYNSQIALVLVGKALGLRHMGRKFFSALTEADVSASSLSSSYLATAALALAAYITPFTGIGGGTITPGVVDAAGSFHAFVGGFVSSLLGTCRRRKVGRGV